MHCALVTNFGGSSALSPLRGSKLSRAVAWVDPYTLQGPRTLLAIRSLHTMALCANSYVKVEVALMSPKTVLCARSTLYEMGYGLKKQTFKNSPD